MALIGSAQLRINSIRDTVQTASYIPKDEASGTNMLEHGWWLLSAFTMMFLQSKETLLKNSRK